MECLFKDNEELQDGAEQEALPIVTVMWVSKAVESAPHSEPHSQVQEMPNCIIATNQN